MLTGSDVRSSIDEAVRRALNEAANLDRESAALAERLVALRREESETYQKLARFRLNGLDSNSIVRDLDAVEKEAHRLLNARSAKMSEIEARLTEAEAEFARLEQQRRSLEDEIERLNTAVAEADEGALRQLADTDAYRAQQAQAEEAEATAHHAEQKTAFAERDRMSKEQAYEADPLFMYLWKRGYGTPTYRAGAIVRSLDRRVARLIRYDQARANYSVLQEIPRRLAEHATRQRERADTEADALARLEEEALSTGTSAERRAALARATEELDALEERRETLTAARLHAVDARATLSRGDDDASRQALDTITAALRRTELEDLREQALRTPVPEDDELVAALEEIDAEIGETEKALEKTRSEQAAQRERISDLESRRREYRHRETAGDAWDFRNGGVLTTLLTEMLRGGLSKDLVWDQMRQRRRPRIGMPGSRGGFGFPRLPGGIGRGRAPRMPRMPRMPRRPRGGFGGGGFRTGGGF